MKQFNIRENEAGQRFDKYLFKLLKNASPSFIYKMLRKKNITLNGKKSDGKNILSFGDEVKIFFTDETFEKFSEAKDFSNLKSKELKNIKPEFDFEKAIIYEDEDYIFVNKPSGILSQKAKDDDISINEIIISYLLNTGAISSEELNTFKPSVCNRLDRNTSGLITAGKSLKGVQFLSKSFKCRTMEKYYLCVVEGSFENNGEFIKVEGYLKKDSNSNIVNIFKEPPNNVDADYICTEYKTLVNSEKASLLLVHLITGKTHQIRAHLSSLGHPIAGDLKYGRKNTNDYFKKKYGVNNQLLHSYALIFEDNNDFGKLAGKTFTAKPDKVFNKVLQGEFNGNLEIPWS